MDKTRYEIHEQLATGDFATVYRGKDRDLGRDVAIKQIHLQFLGDPARLDRYWKEAQLLASLQHPHILTIYDIVRSHGWLVLELMQGSLKDKAQGLPLNLDYLRIALHQSLQALKFLHANKIIHGDIKPSNLLVDKGNRIKLGDFGLARRAASDEGSLLKGTTKYMAPETLSDQFGPVGPASDLYSLGFSAYELLCGDHFESLFPGLNAFGRDKQIAWMMWHAAADRKLPEISRVLQGVPPDLAGVIEKLAAKDPAQRYRTADQAIKDLVKDSQPKEPGTSHPEDAAPPAGMTPEKKKRLMAVGAFAFSCLLSAAMLIPWGSEASPKPVAAAEPDRGVVRGVLVPENKLILEVNEQPLELALAAGDRIFLNDRPGLLRQLQPGDLVAVKRLTDAAGRKLTEVTANRPERIVGKIESVQADEGQLILEITAEDGSQTKLPLNVPRTTKIAFNGANQVGDRPLRLADLQPGDVVEAVHVEQDAGATAVELSVRRLVALSGVIRAVDAAKQELTVALTAAENSPLVVLPLAERCEVTLNGRQIIKGELLGPADLKPGDAVNVRHDTHAARIDARRDFQDAGEVHAVQDNPPLIQVFLRGDSSTRDYRVGAKCKLTLAGEPLAFEDLRRGDEVVVSHDDPEGGTADASNVTVARPADPRHWAAVISQEKFDDSTLVPSPHATADAALVRDAWLKRFRVPPQQLLELVDESRIRLEQGLPAFLQKIPADGQLYVYYAGRSFVDEDRQAFLAAKDFTLGRLKTAGLPLTWLIEQLESCPAREKWLLLDSCHAASPAELSQQPASAELIVQLQPAGQPAALKTLAAVASCQPGQIAHASSDGEHGRFAEFLAAGFSGKGDKNRDNRLELTELFEYVDGQMLAAANDSAQAQRPALFLANAAPKLRLSPEAQQAIRDLLANLGRTRIEADELAKPLADAVKLAGKEPEPKLAYGLVLLKFKKFDEAMRPLEDVKLAFPKLLLAHELTTWLQFNKRNYVSGLAGLTQMLGAVPQPKKAGEVYPESCLALFEWAGRLREFSQFAGAGTDDTKLGQAAAKLDAAVAEHPGEPQLRYAAAREAAKKLLAEFDARIEAADNEPARAKLRSDKRQLGNFAALNVERSARQVLERLEQ